MATALRLQQRPAFALVKYNNSRDSQLSFAGGKSGEKWVRYAGLRTARKMAKRESGKGILGENAIARYPLFPDLSRMTLY